MTGESTESKKLASEDQKMKKKSVAETKETAEKRVKVNVATLMLIFRE